jgi:ABC-type glycerol-3-phosphate transport system substrate-binding protein
MVYSPKLLARAGVAEPKQGWTWSDFRDAAQRASRPPDTWGLSTHWIMHHLLSWVGTMGSAFVSPDKRRMTLNTPEVLEAVEFLLGLMRGNVTSPVENTELFQKATDAAVFEATGPFRMPTFRQKGIHDFAVIHHPQHPVKKVIAGYTDGSEIVVFKGIPAGREAAAGRVALWLNAPLAQARQCIAATVVPVSKGAYSAKELQDYLRTDAQFKGFVDVASLGRPARFPSLPSYAVIVNQTITPGLKEIYGQKVGAREGLTELQRVTQQQLEQDLKLLS